MTAGVAAGVQAPGWHTFAVLNIKDRVSVITERVSVSDTPDEVLRAIEESFAPHWDVSHSRAASGQLAVVERYRPWQAVALAILFFPIGLLALYARSDAEIFVGAYQEGDHTLVAISGRSHAWMRDHLMALLTQR
jgi:hypothetical protein